MIALLDVGNSRVKWQLRSQDSVIAEGNLPTAELTAWRPEWAGNAEAAIISCVAGRWATDCLSDRIGLSPDRMHVIQSSAEAHGIVNPYRRPEQLGSDRFASLIAACRLGMGNCLVVSAGTALCVDMLSADGRFLGGCIVPGPDLMRRSLTTGTAGASSLAGEFAEFPMDTDAAVETGITLAMCGVVEALDRRLQASVRGPVRRVLTGGARAYLRNCHGDIGVEIENLVLEGLAWITRDLGYAL